MQPMRQQQKCHSIGQKINMWGFWDKDKCSCCKSMTEDKGTPDDMSKPILQGDVGVQCDDH